MSASGTLLVDRFVSASSAADAKASLESIAKALQQQPISASATADGSDEQEGPLSGSVIWKDEEVLEAFLQVLTTGEFKSMPVDQGPPIVCQIYSALIAQKGSNVLLHQPQPGRLIQSLIDVISNAQDSAYARVSSLQVLQKICKKYPSVAQGQLLEVPNGLHRLADLFSEENDQVRNEVLLLAKIVASWPPCAKIWVFSEVCDKVMDLTIQEGGLTGGNVLVMDCLDLLCSLLKHDASQSELVWQSRTFAPKLSSLLDLRRGTEFMNPKKPSPADADDLDDILQSNKQEDAPLVPLLTEAEESVLGKVIDVIDIMMCSNSLRQSVWKQHATLGSLTWELSLLSPPPPGIPYACSMPSPQLQQKALECVAESFSSPEIMHRHNGLDRLLFLVCSGGAATHFQEKLGLSQAALHVIRKTLPAEIADETVLRTLAPPISDDNPESDTTVLRKLLNTVLENIEILDDSEIRTINLVGSLGALGVFLRNTTSREMMLRITVSDKLVDKLLKSLQRQNETIALSIVRFICEWMKDTPAVVEALLSSAESTALSIVFSSSGKLSTLTGLLLGMAMEYMNAKEPEKYGGFTRPSILAMLSKGRDGLSGFTSELENFKKCDLSWCACRLELQEFLKWYTNEVLLVRGRIVQELTRGNDAPAHDDAGEGSSTALQQMVSQLSKEVEQLRKDLSDATSAVESRDKQLDTWKRRAESTPTQLDDMLTLLTAKKDEQEKAITSLQHELEETRKSHGAQLQDMSQLLESTKEELEACRAQEQQSRDDAERVGQELGALSTAYSSLEEEYNRSQMSAPAQDGTSDADQAQQQPQGEGSSQQHEQPELEELRNENLRLRNDARAADEWMQLAHQRMGELGSENRGLQEQITCLQAKDTEPEPESTTNELERELSEEKERREQLEKEILALKSTLTSEGSESAKSSNAAVEGKEEAQREEIEHLRTELQLAQAEATALNEARRQLESQLAAHTDLGEPSEGELVQALQADLHSREKEIDSLRNSLQSIQDELAVAKSSMETSVSAAVVDKENTIAQLRTEIDLIRAGKSDTSKDEEISKLKTANDAANDWMQKAVEHHQVLSAQVSALGVEKESLNDQLLGCSNDMDDMKSRLSALQETLAVYEKEREESGQHDAPSEKPQATADLEDSMRRYENDIQELTSKLLEKEKEAASAGVKHNTFVRTIHDEIESLCRDLAICEGIPSTGLDNGCDDDNTAQAFHTVAAAVVQSFQTQNEEKQRLADEISRAQAEVETKTVENANLASHVGELQEWATGAQERIAALLMEKDQHEVAPRAVEASSSDVAALELRKHELEKEADELRSRAHLSENELENKNRAISELEDNLKEKEDILQAEHEKCVNLREQLEVHQDLAAEKAEADASLLQAQQELEQKKLQFTGTLSKLEATCTELREKVSSAEWATEVASSKSAMLEETVRDLEGALERQQQEAEATIGLWSTQYSDLEKIVSGYTAEKDVIIDEKENAEKLLAHAQEEAEKKAEIADSLMLQLQVKENDIASLESDLHQYNARHDAAIHDLQQKLAASEALAADHERSLMELGGERHTMENLREQVQALELALSEKENMHVDNEASARQAVDQWEIHCNNLQTEKDKLSLDLSAALEESEQARQKLAVIENDLYEQLNVEKEARLEAEQTAATISQQVHSIEEQSGSAIQQWQERVEYLESEVSGLKEGLELQQGEATDAIAQWEGTCSELETKLEAAEESMQSITQLVIDFLQEENERLESLANLVVTDHVCDGWELSSGDTSYADLPGLMDAMRERYGDAVSSGARDLVNRLAESESRNASLLAQAEQSLATLQKLEQDITSLTQACRDKEIKETELSLKCDEFETKLSEAEEAKMLAVEKMTDLEHQIQSQTQSNDSMSIALDRLRSQKATLEEQLSSRDGAFDKLEGEYWANLTQTEELKSALGESITKAESLSNEREELKIALKTQKEETAQLEVQLQQTVATDSSEISSFRLKCDRLEADSVRLEEELASANEALQIRVTDEVAFRATQVATDALRHEVLSMRNTVDSDRDLLVEERRERLKAENEVAALKADLSVLLRMDEKDGSTDDCMSKMVMKTADFVQQQERKELFELRTSLNRTLDEVSSLRLVEQDASTRAASLELQLISVEQELISAKSDITFLTQSLEEAREAEAARVACFEYRVSALEDDREILRRSHADELETLRNEVSQVRMEKDRVLHSLKESEKTNAALVYATSMEQDGYVDSVDPQMELSRLRCSNAQLLTATSDEASRTERRIREAIAANSSLAEADVLVERELRMAAEAAVENVKSQLEEARLASERDGNVRAGDSKSVTASAEIKSLLSQAQEKARKLEKENVTLRKASDKAKAEYDTHVADLTEQCRSAQALALKLDRVTKFVPEVGYELKKMQSLTGQHDPFVGANVNPAEESDGSSQDTIPAVEAYDHIQDLTKAIKDERQLYEGLLSEHDNLLALLTQQDLEKDSLRRALVSAAGESAAREAIEEAEHTAVSQFGKYVRLAN